MKKSEIQKLKIKSVAELEKDLLDSKDKLRILVFDLASGKVKNTSDIRETKKRIARLLTLLKVKKVDESEKK